MPEATPPAQRKAHPVLFGVLIIPFGVLGGYLSVAVAFMLRHAGLSVEQIAALIAFGLTPHVVKFAWAPIGDTTLSRKKWYWIGNTVVSLGVFATGALPATKAGLTALYAVVLISNIASTFIGFSAESLLAYGTEENEKGRAGGWYQAGNLGGAGIGGGLGLWLAQLLPAPWMASAIVALLCFACGLALFALPEPAADHRHPNYMVTLKNVGLDLWGVAKSRLGFMALFLCFLPIGSGAAGGLWATVAGDWHTDANAVALWTGVLAGVFSAVGCVIGGYMCDRMNRQMAYALFGVWQACNCIVMAISPHTMPMFILWTSVYSLVTGFTYAGFSAFVLEAMGRGAAATKYNVFASLSNFPIWYMTLVDGWGYKHFQASGMLFTEAALGGVGLVLFLTVTSVVNARARATLAT
jgi:MFS family permease